jgi:general secretion pathway protein A
MYEPFYGLRERAFELTPDPRFLVLTRTHREALSNVEYGVTSRRGVTLLLGEAGTGKTTILRKALSMMGEDPANRLSVLYMSNPTLTRTEFIEFVADKLSLGTAAERSKTRFLRELEGALMERRSRGETVVFVIDEAQSLPLELLEEIRLLGNIQSDTEPLLPLVLAGQPELSYRLNEPELRQLKQRIALRCTLSPLTLQETASYIAARIRLAGGNEAAIFSRDAVVAIDRYSRGIPRTISVICDNALLSGLATDRRPVDRELIDEVCADFDLGRMRPVPLTATPERPVSPPADPHTTDRTRPPVSSSWVLGFGRSEQSSAPPRVARRNGGSR